MLPFPTGPWGTDFGSLFSDALQMRLDEHRVERTFHDGTFLYRQGDPVDAIYRLVEGEWKLVRTSGTHHAQILQFLVPGDCVGIIPILDGGPSPYSVQSAGTSLAYTYPGQVARALLMETPEGIDSVLNHFGHRIRNLVDLADSLSLRSVPERVAALLLARREGGSLVEFQEDQEALGQFIGCTRSAFNRALRMLANLGLIRTTFPVVKILDLPMLERFAGPSPGLRPERRAGD